NCSKCFPYINKSIIKEREKKIKKHLSYVDLFTGPSNFIKSRYTEFGIPKIKYLASENGQKVFKAIEPPKRSNNNFRLVYIGQINNFKGIQILLKSMKLLEQYQKITLDIHGKFQNMPDFNSSIMTIINSLKSVTFHGPYSQDKLPKILSNYDVLIVPSIWWENSPLVIQEGFMARLPIICSDIGGMAEKVHDQLDGLHFKTGDSKDLSKKILYLFNNQKILTQFKSNIPKVKSIEDNRTELEEIYSKLIG
ncbi:MAG: glycosyltransferase, partial [Sphaerochaetaceae bacterium]|nr:glycosyltransferase [Sphaerochaetaceae bacterium]